MPTETRPKGWEHERSPFTIAEQTIQARVGVRDKIERFGRQILRTYMPDQHRDFFRSLPFMPTGYVDRDGWPWATVLTGEPGFISSPDQYTLAFGGLAGDADPIHEELVAGAPVGFCGIEFQSRRRNRVNMRVDTLSSDGFSARVDQSFGNCPQYIQTRHLDFDRPAVDRRAIKEDVVDLASDELPEEAQALITGADTFFVATYEQAGDDPVVNGVDVSHRGGLPGFVKLDGKTLCVPDFMGNFHFSTLGNIMTTGKAGLVFFDFHTGDLLQLTGRAALIWDGPVVEHFKGAERAWTLEIEKVRWLRGAFPHGWAFGDYAPTSQINGTWAEADQRIAAEAKREEWLAYRLVRVEDESSLIRSFYFEPASGEGLLAFKAGQFLTIRIEPDKPDQSLPSDSLSPVIRTYTLSSAPHEPYYRISVKREDGMDGAPDGLASCWLHGTLKVGDIIEAKAPAGDFFIDADEPRPAVLLAGGVGITPMVSMARHVLREGLRTRHLRPLTIIHAAKTTKERAFFAELSGLMQASEGGLRYISMVSAPRADDVKGENYNGRGRITPQVLQSLLPLADYDFYLCGPTGFMQAMYDHLRSLGVRDARIMAESFGPASLTRQADAATSAPPALEDAAEEAVVVFAKDGVEQRWDLDAGSLLELAESHGLEPPYACRNGVCGSCKVKLLAGKVTYAERPSAAVGDDEALLCCAVPAKGSEVIELDV